VGDMTIAQPLRKPNDAAGLGLPLLTEFVDPINVDGLVEIKTLCLRAFRKPVSLS
jgi:hypothetical protein